MISVADQQDIKKGEDFRGSALPFSALWLSKTTMNEIAGDLSMSKALLYYYFPDKSQLYVAVMRKVANDYLGILESRVNTFTNLKEAFEFHINTQHDFCSFTNYNFFDFFRLNEQNLPDTIWEIVERVHSTEISYW